MEFASGESGRKVLSESWYEGGDGIRPSLMEDIGPNNNRVIEINVKVPWSCTKLSLHLNNDAEKLTWLHFLSLVFVYNDKLGKHSITVENAFVSFVKTHWIAFCGQEENYFGLVKLGLNTLDKGFRVDPLLKRSFKDRLSDL